MKIPAYFSLVLIFLGCATANVLLVRPRSGDMVEAPSGECAPLAITEAA